MNRCTIIARGIAEINHQRRIFPVCREMRLPTWRSGSLGKNQTNPVLVTQAMFSVTARLIDTVNHFNGDNEVKWVFSRSRAS